MLLDKDCGNWTAKVEHGNGGTDDVDALDVLYNMSDKMSDSEYDNWLSMIQNYSPFKEAEAARRRGKKKRLKEMKAVTHLNVIYATLVRRIETKYISIPVE